MAEQALIQFRADRALKEEVSDIFAAVGLDMSTALRMFLLKAKQVRGLPFEAVLSEPQMTEIDALSVISRVRGHLKNTPEMTMDEIDAEIQASRRARKTSRK